MFFGNFRHLTGPRSFSGIHGISEGVAKRKNPTATVRVSIDTNIACYQPTFTRFQRPTKIERVVVTLDPNKLAEKKQQSLFISNQESFKPRVALAKEFIRSPRLVYDWTRQADQQTHWPYPPDTRAFLYYTTIPGKPRIAGELRLRLASSDDPASFTGGSDLLRINGQPWSRPLYFLNKFYTALYQKMREERLVPDDLDAVLSTFPTRRFIYSRSQILYTLDDTFVIDFSGAAFLSIITEQGVETMPFIRVFKDSRSTCGYNPYTGAYTNHHLSNTLGLMILMNL